MIDASLIGTDIAKRQIMFETDEPFDLAGMTLRAISPVELGYSPLEEEIRSLRDDGEDYELFEIKIPGERRRAYLLHRPYVNRAQIVWGNETFVKGYYAVTESVVMFRERLKERGEDKESRMPDKAPEIKNSVGLETPEGVGPPPENGALKKAPRASSARPVDCEAVNSRRVELLNQKHGMRPNEKFPSDLEAELGRLQEMMRYRVAQVAPQDNSVLEAFEQKASETMPETKRRGRPKGSKNKGVALAPQVPTPSKAAPKGAHIAVAPQELAPTNNQPEATAGKRRGRLPRTVTRTEALAIIGIEEMDLEWLVEAGHVREYEPGIYYARDVDNAWKFLDDEGETDLQARLIEEVRIDLEREEVVKTATLETILVPAAVEEMVVPPIQERLISVANEEIETLKAARDFIATQIEPPTLTAREIRVVKAFVGLIDALLGRE